MKLKSRAEDTKPFCILILSNEFLKNLKIKKNLFCKEPNWPKELFPHVKTSPCSVRKMEKSHPAAISTILSQNEITPCQGHLPLTGTQSENMSCVLLKLLFSGFSVTAQINIATKMTPIVPPANAPLYFFVEFKKIHIKILC